MVSTSYVVHYVSNKDGFGSICAFIKASCSALGVRSGLKFDKINDLHPNYLHFTPLYHQILSVWAIKIKSDTTSHLYVYILILTFYILFSAHCVHILHHTPFSPPYTHFQDKLSTMSDDGGVGENEHKFPAHYKVMLDKLNEQRQLDQFTDITLIVDGENSRLRTDSPSPLLWIEQSVCDVCCRSSVSSP